MPGAGSVYRFLISLMFEFFAHFGTAVNIKWGWFRLIFVSLDFWLGGFD
jgi:hypothetical protein